VQACWRDGALLVPMLQGPEHRYPVDCVREASVAQRQFARDTVMVCELGTDCEQAALEFGAQIAAAGERWASDTYATAQFCRSFGEFCAAQFDDMALHRYLSRPRAGQDVLRWVRSAGATFIPPILLVLLLGWLRFAAQSTAITRPAPHPPQRGRTLKRRVRGWAGRYSRVRLPVDGRRRYGQADTERLLQAGCTYAQIARLCRISESTVSRYVTARGLGPLAAQARVERKRTEVRGAWTRACHRYPNRSRNAIRILEPRAYRWLVTHDKAWLRQQCQAFERRHGWRRGLLPTPGSAAIIAARIRRVHRTILTIHWKARCTRSALCRALGVTPYLFDRWRKASPLIAAAVKKALE